MDDSNNNNTCKRKANKDLTPQERKAKRALKKQLKVQQKRAKLESRLRHALSRKDAATEEATRQALQEFAKQEENNEACSNDDKIVPINTQTPEREFILSICSQLQGIVQSQESKKVQTDQAVALLRNMTKGTQSKSMFENANALVGYTRQKFFSRAMLVCSCFLKLKPNECCNNDVLRKQAWEKLTSVRRVCSVGCGPGNDAVGVVAFLKATGKSNPQLERVVLLDWTMNDWKLIVEPLCDIVVPTCIQTVEASFCDVSESFLNAECNEQARELLQVQQDNSSFANVDLFLISYLLTEVRGQWHGFVKELVQNCMPDTLFYFAEPTPWQLHRLKELCGELLDFIWLDSSMDEPEMQPLDNRLGPGVLLGRRKQ